LVVEGEHRCRTGRRAWRWAGHQPLQCRGAPGRAVLPGGDQGWVERDGCGRQRPAVALQPLVHGLPGDALVGDVGDAPVAELQQVAGGDEAPALDVGAHAGDRAAGAGVLQQHAGDAAPRQPVQQARHAVRAAMDDQAIGGAVAQAPDHGILVLPGPGDDDVDGVAVGVGGTFRRRHDIGEIAVAKVRGDEGDGIGAPPPQAACGMIGGVAQCLRGGPHTVLRGLRKAVPVGGATQHQRYRRLRHASQHRDLVTRCGS